MPRIKSLDELRVRERDPPHVQAREQRRRVHVGSRLVPDHLRAPAEVDEDLVGDDLRPVPMLLEPLLDGEEGAVQVEEVDVLAGARRVELLQELAALLARRVRDGERRARLLEALLLHVAEDQVERGEALLPVDEFEPAVGEPLHDDRLQAVILVLDRRDVVEKEPDLLFAPAVSTLIRGHQEVLLDVPDSDEPQSGLRFDGRSPRRRRGR